MNLHNVLFVIAALNLLAPQGAWAQQKKGVETQEAAPVADEGLRRAVEPVQQLSLIHI